MLIHRLFNKYTMQVNPHMFRGYDLRGVSGRDLTPEIVEHLGRAYSTFLLKNNINKAVIGHDCRLTSESYSQAIIKGLLASGIDVVDIGLALTGTIYWAQYYFKAEGCVSVSASHNPAEYNGFKFGVGYSRTMVENEIQELRKIVEQDNFISGRGNLTEKNITEMYFADLIKRFPKINKFRVVIDPGCSTPGAFVPELLKKAGCEVIESNCELDGSFPTGTPDPTEKKVAERLSKKILAEKADLGFSYDSDGDRIGIVDGDGGIIWNDVLVALFAIDVLADHPGAKIMFNILCSKVVPDTIAKFGGVPFMWRVGHSFLKKKNQEVKAAFIGELSGHFFFSADFYNHDDGLYTTMRLLHYLSRAGQTLAQAVAALPKYISSPEIKVGCGDEVKVGLMEKIAIKLRTDYPAAEVIDDERAGDGVRLEMPDSMLVIRYSQNGPYITIKFEALTQDKYNQLKTYIHSLLHEYKEIDWSFGVNVENLS